MCNKGITQFYLPPTHEPRLLLLPSSKASPPFGRYQHILLGEQRHIGVRNLPRVLRHVPGQESNPRSLDHKSDTLLTVPRCHYVQNYTLFLTILCYFRHLTVNNLNWVGRAVSWPTLYISIGSATMPYKHRYCIVNKAKLQVAEPGLW